MFEFMQNIFHSKLFWITAFIALLYLYLKKVVYSYWKNHGVIQDTTAVPTGIFGLDFFTRKISISDVLKRSYDKFKKHPYHGLYFFHNRVLMINDLEVIKHVLSKDFSYFSSRGFFSNPEIDPLSSNVFFLSGEKWKTFRTKLSPTLSSGRLKHIFPILKDIAEEMVEVIHQDMPKTSIFELKDLTARYTTDTIFSLAFGLQSNCLREPNNQFRYYGELLVKGPIVRGSLAFFAPELSNFFKVSFVDPRVCKFFVKLFADMVEKRRADSIKRKDFLDSLIELMDHEQVVDDSMLKTSQGISADKIAKKSDLFEAASQAFAFFFAGFETSSSIVTHCLYELALNPDVQETVQNEIDEFLMKPEGLTYENLSQLEYLDMVFCETMRLHPSLAYLNRESNREYRIPNSDLVIPKGTKIVISVSGLQCDPDIYPEPKKFDPLRFSKENVAARHSYAYLPFGGGPMLCLGKRLGILQSKMALFQLLSNFKFSICDKTSVPNEYATDSLLQTPKTGMYLKLEKRTCKK